MKERIFVAIKNIIDEVYENQDSYILFQSADGIIVIILKSDEHDKKLINFIREIIGIKIDIREILKFNSILDLSGGLLGENEVAEVVTRIITNMVSMNIHDAQKDLKNCINKICRKDNLEELLSILKDKLLAAISIYWNTVGIKNVSIFEMADHLDKYINDLNRPEAEYNDIIIERSKDYIMKNYNRDISISDVSKNVYLSAEYFGRYFKKATGQSVGSFLVEIRMNKAIEYLAENKTVKEISESVGYMDYRYFLRVFKKYTECSPKEYRKKYLRNDQN